MSQYSLLRTVFILLLLFFFSKGAIAASTTSAATEVKASAANVDTDRDKITQTLVDYMEGTANGEPDRLRHAFHPDFKLYAVSDADRLIIRSGEEYIAGFRPGEKSNRIGRILAIDFQHDVATAKVEILMPNFRLYTDYFMLLKYQGDWKIVQKSYTWKAIPTPGRKILFVTSNQHTYGNTDLNAANHFEEIVVAYDVFKKGGYTVDFVSPHGGAIPLGYVQTSNPTQKEYLYNAEFMNALKNTFSPDQVDAHEYQAVYYSGGGAAMFGVADNPGIRKIASKVYQDGGVISAICHGTAGLVNLQDANGNSILLNRKITGFPDLFEDTKAEYYKTFPFSIGEEVGRKGGDFVYSRKWAGNYVVVDGNIVTGQDPSATASVAQKVIQVIEGKKT